MAEKTTNYNLTKPSADDFYDVGVQNGNMDIVDAELKKLNDEKAPSGHGLGKSGEVFGNTPLIEVMQRGCGFYQVGHPDSPLPSGEWMGLIQMVRNHNEGSEGGTQLAFYDFSTSNPRMWMRNMIAGSASNWVEMLHTGNYSNYANARITIGSYVGVVSSEKSSEVVLSFDFPPKLIILRGKTSDNIEFTATFLHGCDGHYILVKDYNTVHSHEPPTIWEGNSVKLQLSIYESKYLNWSGNTYTYVAIG